MSPTSERRANNELRVGLAASEAEIARLRQVLAVADRLRANNAHTLTDLLASEASLATSQAKTKEVQTDLLASAVALALSRAETKESQADLLASAVALVSSQAETKEVQTDLLATAVALALSRAETKESQADLLASAVTLALSRAETKEGQAELLASAVALALSRAETKEGQTDLLASAIALASLQAAMAVERRATVISSEVQKKLATANIELTLAKQRAEQADQAKSRFLAAITHELRTPLHGILGYAELLILDGDLNATQSQRLEVMIASGEHLLASINEVLDLSQIDANQLELHTVEINLVDLVQTCLNVIRPAAEAKGIELNFTPSVSLRLVADATRLRQILINLLGNAVKFTPAGSVTVRLHQPGAGAPIRLEVADTGPGIWLKHRDKLFREFERINAAAVAGIEGAGLGLAISARLVRLMGGDIGYLDNPAGGSVFWFELPVGDFNPLTDESARPIELPSGRRLRVLVADDEALNRSIASNFLMRAGHEVVCVEDGATAVEAAATDDFDVVLMDVRMPGLNGMEATRQIRGLPAPRGKVRVVAVTAQAFTQQIDLCKQAGMDDHVSKPFKQAVLLAALQGAAETAPRAVASGFPIFDRATFEDATNCLAAAELEEHLLSLEMRCEALLRRLRAPGMPADARALTEDAHRLAGGAGTFGFLLIAAAARDFEVAAETDAAETGAFVDRLAAAIETSMTAIRRELTAVVAAAI